MEASLATRKTKVLWTAFHRFWPDVAIDAMCRRYADDFQFEVIEWPCTNAGRLRFMAEVMRSDVVVRVGMRAELEGRSNQLWSWFTRHIFRGPVVSYWTGTDVFALLKRQEAKGIDPRLRAELDRTYHFAASPHLAAELAEAGVHSRVVEFLTPEREVPDPPPALPGEFSVLAYWGEGNDQELFELYGGPTVFSAARAMPDVRFDVIGTTGKRMRDVPPNVVFHGLVPDVGPFLERSVVLLRNIEHDAVASSMVEEALAYGRYAIYSFEWPNTILVPFGDSGGVIKALQELRDRHERGELPLNLAGREFTLHDWNPDRRCAELRQALLDVRTMAPADL